MESRLLHTRTRRRYGISSLKHHCQQLHGTLRNPSYPVSPFPTLPLAPLRWRFLRHMASQQRGTRQVPPTHQPAAPEHQVHHGGWTKQLHPLPWCSSHQERPRPSCPPSLQETDPHRQIPSLPVLPPLIRPPVSPQHTHPTSTPTQQSRPSSAGTQSRHRSPHQPAPSTSIPGVRSRPKYQTARPPVTHLPTRLPPSPLYYPI